MSSENIDIGEVVAATGVPVSTLHVWERSGLLNPSGRSGLRRQYPADTVERIGAIILMQRGGFTLAEIAALLAPGAADNANDHLEAKLGELREHRRQLDAAIAGLEHALSCREAAPLECARFRAMISDVLPVDRSSS